MHSIVVQGSFFENTEEKRLSHPILKHGPLSYRSSLLLPSVSIVYFDEEGCLGKEECSSIWSSSLLNFAPFKASMKMNLQRYGPTGLMSSYMFIQHLKDYSITYLKLILHSVCVICTFTEWHFILLCLYASANVCKYSYQSIISSIYIIVDIQTHNTALDSVTKCIGSQNKEITLPKWL